MREPEKVLTCAGYGPRSSRISRRLYFMLHSFFLEVLVILGFSLYFNVHAVFSQEFVSASDLAFHWAPIHYQDIDKASNAPLQSLSGRADYISKFTYDGDLVGTNNWDNLDGITSIPAFAYYAMAENSTHWFIYYQFYHPRDWARSFADVHENDAEGVLMFIRKNGTMFGSLEGMITQAHGTMHPYRAPSATYLTPGPAGRQIHRFETEQLDGETFGRPRTYQEPQGHGFFACGSHVTNCVRRDDGIRYVPSLELAGVPPIPVPDGTQVTVSYRLIDMTQPNGLFHQRSNSSAFFNATTFRGDDSGTCGTPTLTCRSNAANPAWAWDDGNDSLANTAFGDDPALFVRTYFSFGAQTAPDSAYLRHDFTCGHDIAAVGGPLVNSCTSCVQSICLEDAFCCTAGWDQICVGKVSSICGFTTPACSHDMYREGPALKRGCTHCVSEICAVDPFCCNNEWDSLCVAEVSSICDI